MGHSGHDVDGAQSVSELRFKGRHLSRNLEQLFGNGLRRAGTAGREQHQADKVTVETIEDIGVKDFILRRGRTGIPLRWKLAQKTIHNFTEVGTSARQPVTGEIDRLTSGPSSK